MSLPCPRPYTSISLFIWMRQLWGLVFDFFFPFLQTKFSKLHICSHTWCFDAYSWNISMDVIFLGRGNRRTGVHNLYFPAPFLPFPTQSDLLTKRQFPPYNFLWTYGWNCFDAMTHNSLSIIKKTLRCGSW